MIVWRGYGWLALTVAVVINVSLNGAANAVFSAGRGITATRSGGADWHGTFGGRLLASGHM